MKKVIFAAAFVGASVAAVPIIPIANVIYGANARGKTNILESIYIMSTSRSHRGSKESEMIRFGQNSAKIAAKFHSHGRINKAEIDFFNDKKKRIKINF